MSAFIEWLAAIGWMTWAEWVAVLFGLLAVWFVVRQNIWCWPTGLVQVALYSVIFFQVKLYSDALLHLVYVVLQIYGWYHWLHGGANRSALPVTRLAHATLKGRTGALAWEMPLIGWVAIALLGTLAWGWIMSSKTDAAFPFADAFTTVTSLIAMWLQARKKIESWVFWIAVDVIAVGVYYLKGLHPTAGLYCVFGVLSVIGLFSWRKTLMQAQL